jgi:hypothetical protein
LKYGVLGREEKNKTKVIRFKQHIFLAKPKSQGLRVRGVKKNRKQESKKTKMERKKQRRVSSIDVVF